MEDRFASGVLAACYGDRMKVTIRYCNS